MNLLLAALTPKPENSKALFGSGPHPIDSNEAPRNLHVMEYFQKIFFW
jgi:hypothetical protein